MITEYDIQDEVKKRMPASPAGTMYHFSDETRAMMGAMAHFLNAQEESMRAMAHVLASEIGKTKAEDFKRDFLTELRML